MNQVFAVAVFSLLVSVSAESLLAHGGTNMSPSQSSQRFLQPERIGGPRLVIESMRAAAAYSESYSGRALLVMQNGEVIFERYADGWTADKPHALASGTKSFVGVVAMAAIEDGLIDSLDELVSDTLKEWQSDARKSKITVRQLLDLSSGLQPNHDSFGRAGAGIENLGPVNNAATRLQRVLRRDDLPGDRFAAAVAVPTVDEPGRTFRYGASHFYAFGALLDRKLKASDRPEKSYFAYMNSRVLEPAGIPLTIARYAPDRSGNPNLPGGGHLTAREWAMFGEFVRLGGATRDEDGHVQPHLSPGVLEPCFHPSAANRNYGLTWWLLNGQPGDSAEVADAGAGGLGRLRNSISRVARGGRQAARQAAQTAAVLDSQDQPIAVAMAAGAGKQRLYILPAQGLVVVRFASMTIHGSSFSDTEFLRTLLGISDATPPHLGSK